MSVSRLRDIPGIGVDKVGDAADAAADPRFLRLEKLDTDLRPPEVALEATRAAIDRDDTNSYLPFQGHLALRRIAWQPTCPRMRTSIRRKDSAASARPPSPGVPPTPRADSHIDSAVHIPLHELPSRLTELPNEELWVYCQTGYRASVAASILDAAGRTVVGVDDDYDRAPIAGLPMARRRADSGATVRSGYKNGLRPVSGVTAPGWAVRGRGLSWLPRSR